MHATLLRSTSRPARRCPMASRTLVVLGMMLSGLVVSGLAANAGAAPAEWSGIYPELAAFNNEGECGTGAVVPWADRLWVIT